jgi:hypothetical protein
MSESVRIKVSEAAQILGIGADTLRIALQNKHYTFGEAIKTSSHYTYVIIRKKLYDYIEKNE